MLNLRVVQAQHGDCLLLEYGSRENPKYILVDGGPADVYQAHLRPVLQAIPRRHRSLQRVILSHVDDDHINGILDLLLELSVQHRRGRDPIVGVDELWHNTFSDIVAPDLRGLKPQRLDLVCGVRDLAPGTASFDKGQPMPIDGGATPRSLEQGHDLTGEAASLNLPINQGFQPGRLISLEKAPRPVPQVQGLALYVVGPSDQNLAKLQAEWNAWLAHKLKAVPKDVASDVPAEEPVPKPDDSVFNLSSIMLLVEADGKRILLTGDGLGEHLVHGLEQAGILRPGEAFHVDILKLPHHGSARNVSREFFWRVTADRYVISANGKHDNPDLLTLKWLVDAASKQGRAIEIVITNWTRSICELMRMRDPAEYHYRLVAMDPGDHSMLIRLAD